MRFILALLFLTTVAHAQSAAPCCGGYNLNIPYVGQVATRSFIPIMQTPSDKQVMSRTIHFARAALSSLQIEVPNFYAVSGGTELGNGGTSQITSATVTASLEYPLGTCTQITFGGIATGTMSGVSHLLSDVLSGINIPDRAMFAIRMKYTGSGGVIYEPTQVYNTILGDSGTFGNSVTDQTTSCTPVVDSATGVLFPAAIVASTTKPAVCFIGDSLIQGVSLGFDPTGDAGMIGAPVATNYGYINMGDPSQTAMVWSTNSVNRAMFYKYCSNVIDDLGSNDLSAGTSAVTLEGYLQTIYSAFTSDAAPPAGIERLTIIPRTSSTDNWATTVNQTLPAWESQRIQFNSDVRNETFYTGNYSDADSIMGTGANFGYWQNPVTSSACQQLQQSKYWTSDGTHSAPCANEQLYLSGIVNMNHIHR